jgi:DNA-binding XRE family transcriptional regulator
MNNDMNEQMTGSRRPLTDDEVADAARLKQIWEERKDALQLTQMKAADAMGFTHQAAISQYLNAKIPLNMTVAMKFAKILRVSIRDISPRWAQWAEPARPIKEDNFQFPEAGVIGGYQTKDCVDWFAFSRGFLETVGSTSVKALRLEEGFGQEIAPGSIVLVSEAPLEKMTTGLYLMVYNKGLVVRKIEIEGLTATIHGSPPITMPVETLDFLQVLGRVVGHLSISNKQ